ncbi:MAG: branched-chain amino acid ABC transporter permease [Caldilineaceae bacterium]
MDPRINLLLQQILSGVASGSLFALLGLALVLVYRSTGMLNFAQGELALLAVFIAWSVLNWLGNFWLAVGISLFAAALIGAWLQTYLLRHVQRTSVLQQVIVTIGLYLFCDGLVLWAWGAEPRGFGPFSIFQGAPLCIDQLCISRLDAGTLLTALLVMVLLYLLFQHTKLGKALRATAENPVASLMVGIPVARMFAIGWALSSAVGALAGLLAAQALGLDPTFMSSLLPLAFAGAVLGGLESPPGAVVGGLLIGVLKNLAGAYLSPQLGNIDLSIAFGVIGLVLLIRPEGLLGEHKMQKV